jgi:hydrogen peroxide-dependent heme synthase
MSELVFKPLVPAEGMGVLHLFYSINRSQWDDLVEETQKVRLHLLNDLVEQAKGWPDVQIITLAMIAKADIGFMVLAKDIQVLHSLEKRISRALGSEVFHLVYSFFSLTEKSEYTTSEEEYTAQIIAEDKLEPGSPEFELKMTTFRERIKHYTQDRMYPKLPAWEFFCFYPMSKRRDPEQNWYATAFELRKNMMKGHATVGRRYAGKVMQLVAGCTGLDDWEWGVSLFAHDPTDIKAIVYEMRFDPVTAHYADFGSFYSGLPMTLPQIFERLGLAEGQERA